MSDVIIREFCVDAAVKIVGEPKYIMVDGKWEKRQDNVVDVAKEIYNFIKDFEGINKEEPPKEGPKDKGKVSLLVRRPTGT